MEYIMKKQSKLFLLLCVSLVLCLPACKTTKESAASFAGKSDAEILNSLVDHSLKFNTLSGKLDVNIKTARKSMASKANIKIIKDQAIQVSIQPLFGIEAFKIEFSTDSIKFVDRLNRRYAAEKISELKGDFQLDFNFYNLQALFTNSLFVAGKSQVTPADFGRFTVEKSKDKALIHMKDGQNIQYLFIGDYTDKLQSLYMSETGNRASLLSDYTDFTNIGGSQTFPMQMKMMLKVSSEEEVQLNLSYSKVELDKNIEMDFSIPSKYKRIRLSDAFNSIKNL